MFLNSAFVYIETLSKWVVNSVIHVTRDDFVSNCLQGWVPNYSEV